MSLNQQLQLGQAARFITITYYSSYFSSSSVQPMRRRYSCGVTATGSVLALDFEAADMVAIIDVKLFSQKKNAQ